jgi:hypothetical protein
LHWFLLADDTCRELLPPLTGTSISDDVVFIKCDSSFPFMLPISRLFLTNLISFMPLRLFFACCSRKSVNGDSQIIRSNYSNAP